MLKSVQTGIPNGIVFVEDSMNTIVPDITQQGIIWTKRSSIAIGTKHEDFGDTYIALTNGPYIKTADEYILFEGRIQIPSMVLNIVIVPDNVIISHKLTSVSADLRVWVNHQHSPDRITIVILQKEELKLVF